MKESYEEYRERTIYGQEKAERYAKRKISHQGEFDLVDRAVQLLPPGLYVVRLSVEADKGEVTR